MRVHREIASLRAELERAHKRNFVLLSQLDDEVQKNVALMKEKSELKKQNDKLAKYIVSNSSYADLKISIHA